MSDNKQLWLLAGGNGSGKSTFYRLFLLPRGIKFINADLIARDMVPDSPKDASYKAARMAERLRSSLLDQGLSFCFETVFSHVSKIDFIAKAKALAYEVILVYIHLEHPDLNEARVTQRVTEGGHDVPADKIRSRIPRTMKNIIAALPLVDSAWLLDNSSRENPFRQVAMVRLGRKRILVDPLPSWAEDILCDTP
ncbi:MAG: zeta toxin family protein [Proteobacteria bacterium]|nr:zeta toxin family protein [Pseudomonadota bacterium]